MAEKTVRIIAKGIATHLFDMYSTHPNALCTNT